MADIVLKKGLKDVYFDTTETSYIDGSVGKLLYRGYNIHDLAEQSTFEETMYLLLHGTLPTKNELESIKGELTGSLSLPESVQEIIGHVKNSHPMDVLRTAVSALSATDPDVSDNSEAATLRKGVRLTAQSLVAITSHNRIRDGKTPISADPSLSLAGNFLYTLHGERPTKEETELMDKDFILHAEHGSNASAFGARVAASTLADVHAAITAGLGILKGPLHGGAAEAVMKMSQDIGDESNAGAYVKEKIGAGGRVMGFGHRVYKAEDPRARHLREGCRQLGEKKGQPKWFRILSAVAEEMKPYGSKGIHVNVDFWSGAVYDLLGIPEDLFIPIFALGRVPGWTAQVLEQFSDNILLRPLLQYDGPMDLEYIPLEKRG